MIYLLPVVSFCLPLIVFKQMISSFLKGTLGAAQKLCVELGCEVAETLVIIELIGLGGRERLADVDHFTSLLQFSDAELEAIAAKNDDRLHKSNNA
jgi:hypothetical protein